MPPTDQPSESWSRRRWIKHFMLGTATAFGPYPIWRGTLLADIAPGTPPTDIFSLDLGNFPHLMDGTTPSIQLELSVLNEVIMITRVPFNGQFYVLDSRCTHQGCIVPPWDPNSQMIQCVCHGSQYSYDGSLIFGAAGPMQPPLAQYNFNTDGATFLQIQVPGLNLTINGITVQASSPTNKRLHLSFPGRIGCAYQVTSSTNLQTWSDPVMFATTATGQANNASMIAQSTATQDVWVDNPNPNVNAFYRVELILVDYNE